MERLPQEIRAEAHRLGFGLCGFAPIAPLPHADFVRRWLQEGHGADMSYLERGLAKRLDPRLIRPWVRGVITLGYRYLPPPTPPVAWREELRGRIAAYALGDDYHRIVESKLRDLAEAVRRIRPSCQLLLSVDVGSVLEREWAAAGGIGWFGKNTTILHAHQGSYFFLGELLTDLEFDAEPAVPDHCGVCTRCLDLCPTQALKPGYVLDSRRCISYLTIEHRGAIPPALRAGLGNWIFGCDVCQEVCPWNEKLVRGAPAGEREALLPYLPDLLRLDEEAFRARYRHTALWRAKRAGLLRNVAVALGNSRNPDAVEPLTAALRGDPAAVVRAHAAWGLGAIGGAAARRALEDARRTEADDEALTEIDAALIGR